MRGVFAHAAIVMLVLGVHPSRGAGRRILGGNRYPLLVVRASDDCGRETAQRRHPRFFAMRDWRHPAVRFLMPISTSRCAMSRRASVVLKAMRNGSSGRPQPGKIGGEEIGGPCAGRNADHRTSGRRRQASRRSAVAPASIDSVFASSVRPSLVNSYPDWRLHEERPCHLLLQRQHPSSDRGGAEAEFGRGRRQPAAARHMNEDAQIFPVRIFHF